MFIIILQMWIVLVALMALVNTISCFISHNFLAQKIYTGVVDQVNPLSGRLFGTWTLQASIVRLYGAYYIENDQLYTITYLSFWLALGHFLLECYYYKSAPLTVGVKAPLIVSSISIVMMTAGYCMGVHESGAIEKTEL